jgi:hypothetical protein
MRHEDRRRGGSERESRGRLARVGVLSAAGVAALLVGPIAGQGCAATTDPPTAFGSGGSAADSTAQGTGGSGPAATTSDGVGGSILTTTSGGGMTGEGGTIINPCGTACGDTELCDDAHLGLDDDCDGQVDEGCPCNQGQAHACFKGDPSYHNAPGCYDGTMKCSENGVWGPCVGGVHVDDNCFANDVTNCHAISAVPFQDVNLKTGTGQFSSDAVGESWTVACPAGVSPCPGVSGSNPADDFKPLQSGQYDVTYTKTLQDGSSASCQYPLFVGAPGLRIELAWEHSDADSGVDLDLHVHQPNNNQPWSISGSAQDCTWSNCVVDDFAPFQGFNAPKWFNDVGSPPTPLNWYLDPVFERNTCYFAPRGVGQDWQDYNQGCHNPRLDLDNITCDNTVSDPNDFDFCAPENINIDYPPEGQWIRIGVHYYSNHGLSYDVHPIIKVFCDGALAAELGPTGYYEPESAVTFTPSDGSSFFGGNRFWLAADVAFKDGECETTTCVVQPLYSDPAGKTPFFVLDDAAESNFGPAVPPAP